ncbi:hypothetical protein CEXT_444371 [Caerostris extrusa]|uniref:Uncharacterized protein n=1 Tax=Caerostris extrusa TaxID=172846 RepID=A0AAV4XMB4_CAEEX|nr:hypothetical protein CEXT_444371 [Caerostris extrusa]
MGALVERVTMVPKYDCFPNAKHIAPEPSEMNLFSLRNPITSGDMCLQLRNGMSPILLKWACSPIIAVQSDFHQDKQGQTRNIRSPVERVTIVPKNDCFPNTKHIAPEASEMNLFSLRNPIASGDMRLQLRNGMSPILLKWAGSRSFSLRVLMNLVIAVTAFRTITVSHLRRQLHWAV